MARLGMEPKDCRACGGTGQLNYAAGLVEKDGPRPCLYCTAYDGPLVIRGQERPDAAGRVMTPAEIGAAVHADLMRLESPDPVQHTATMEALAYLTANWCGPEAARWRLEMVEEMAVHLSNHFSKTPCSGDCPYHGEE